MYKLKSIGEIESDGNCTILRIDRKMKNGLKNLDKFSHLHVFYLTEREGEYRIRRVVVRVVEIDKAKACVVTSPINNFGDKGILIDIKPYFPSEDRVKPFVSPNEKTDDDIDVTMVEDLSGYQVNSIGEIRNVNGKMYIQLDHMIQVSSEYLTVFWWFHKYDTDKYREIVECNPPYENSPRCGVFATRSPVRPNPIAMTVVRVIDIDEEKRRIYLNNIESYDKTPCLGISNYDSTKHAISDCKVPEWLAHWPKYIDDSICDRKDSKLPIIDSGAKRLVSETHQSNKNKRRVATNDMIEGERYTEIFVRGARENNLQGIDVCVPYGKITAVVGVSGSGKSSLVNQTIYAECRRRMEYLSNNHNVLQKPKVDEMIGCIPAVVISQDAIHGNSYSTVGTYSDAYDYLRKIYASIATRHCPSCGNEIVPMSKDTILSILENQSNYKIYTISNELIHEDSVEDMVNSALLKGDGAFYLELEDKEKVLLQTNQKCHHCNKILYELTPSTFSYMDNDSRCPICNGSGQISIIDDTKIINHPELSLLDGACSFYGKLRTFLKNPNANWMKGQVFGLAKAMEVDLEQPWSELPDAFKKTLLHGSKQEVTFQYHNNKNGRTGEITRAVEGLHSIISRIHEDNSDSSALDKYMTKGVCDTCDGERLATEGRIATINGIRYPEAASMTFNELNQFCNQLMESLSDVEYRKVQDSIAILIETAEVAQKLGIGYLQLNQETSSLSGGEGQRLKLLGAFKNHLSGILYIFDEPSKGLHPDDYVKITNLFHDLIKEGNTIIMVEHNEDMIKIADYIIEVGPGAGEKGGKLVGEGTLNDMLSNCNTQIGNYLGCGKGFTDLPPIKECTGKQFYKLSNLVHNNLKNISVEFPIKALTCICGVSGSGKSSLLKYEIYNHTKSNKDFSEVILVDQLPIGKNSKSIVATYIGVMDYIRSQFASTDIAIENGLDEGSFSFNNAAGQCSTCKGEGRIKVRFTEGTLIQCPDCKGRRYKKNILEARYKGKNIDEILNLSVGQAIQFFDDAEEVKKGLRSLQKVGLGYLKLGQGTSSLSGGEASRLKLAKELITKTTGNVLYLLDEPTTGLHFLDVENLLKLIYELIVSGNTVIAIEHNKQFVSNSNWIIELGPGAGKEGGYVIKQGLHE